MQGLLFWKSPEEKKLLTPFPIRKRGSNSKRINSSIYLPVVIECTLYGAAHNSYTFVAKGHASNRWGMIWYVHWVPQAMVWLKSKWSWCNNSWQDWNRLLIRTQTKLFIINISITCTCDHHRHHISVAIFTGCAKRLLVFYAFLTVFAHRTEKEQM